jgi:hypothetical protein
MNHFHTPLAWLGSSQNVLEIIPSVLGLGFGGLGGGSGVKSKEPN